MDLGLAGRSCLVTGASQGIGTGVARVMAAEGCRVALVARRTTLMEQLADEISATGAARPEIITEDITQEDAPARILQQVTKSFGALEILVNVAGAARTVPWDAPDEVWPEAMTLNFDSVRRLTHAFIPGMLEQKWGRIITITGTSEPPSLSAASSAKAAVHAWSKGLSRALAPDGVTVNCVPPIAIKSEQILGRIFADPIKREMFIDENIPVGYMGEPEDVGNLVAFIASPKARYITGAVIPVDGGSRRYAF